MEDKKILEQILVNTQEVKQVIVKEKKEKKELTAQQRAQAKFKKVATQLNPQEQERFNKILEAKNTNASAYIKQLIFSGNESVLEDALTEENNKLKAESVELKNKVSGQEQTIKSLNEEIENYKKEIASIEDFGFWQLVKMRFFG